MDGSWPYINPKCPHSADGGLANGTTMKNVKAAGGTRRVNPAAQTSAGGSGSFPTPRIPVADVHKCSDCGKKYKRRHWFNMHFLNGICQKEAARRSRPDHRRRLASPGETEAERVDDGFNSTFNSSLNSSFNADHDYL